MKKYVVLAAVVIVAIIAGWALMSEATAGPPEPIDPPVGPIPIKPIDCRFVLCEAVFCPPGFKAVVPPGECCPVCVPVLK